MALLSVSKSQSKNWQCIMMFLIIMIVHAVVPSSYITIDAQTVSVSGSSATGHCSSNSVSSDRGISTCTDPTSSVLFDGVIPTLTGLDGNMWASQLLTLRRLSSINARPLVLSDFTGTPGYVGLSRVEVVMFNCPEREISASTIIVSTSSSPSAEARSQILSLGIANTSCDSLVTVCAPITTTQPSISFEFATSEMVYLAEVTFYATSSPPVTITTVPPPLNVFTTTSDGTTGTATSKTTTILTSNTTATTGSNTITSVIIPVVVVICVVFMIVGIMAAVLILWRYHKHKTSHHTALGEGHSHAHTHSHPPPVKMCEETGQVCYSSPPEALGQLSPSHDTYSHIQRDTSEGRGGAQSGSCEEGEYSTLSHGNSPHVLGGGGEDSASQPYAQVDKKAKKKKKSTATEMSTLATYSSLHTERSEVHSSETDTAIDQLYAQVDDKKGTISTYPEAGTVYSLDKKKKNKGTHPHTPVADKDIDQLYSQVDKKKKKREVAHFPTQVPDADIDQLYSQVDKKKKKGEVAAHLHTPADIDQLYSQVDKKVKKKKSEVAVHPQTTEAHTPMDQLYAQVDKKKRSRKRGV